MNDDSLYGWIAPGTSKPLPHGTKLTFEQRPAGRRRGRAARHVIRTVANGAATITATATYHGASASTSVRRARALRPHRDLRVERDDGPGLPPGRLRRTTSSLPPGVTDAPQVTGSARTGAVDVTQASASRARRPSPRPGRTASSRPTRSTSPSPRRATSSTATRSTRSGRSSVRTRRTSSVGGGSLTITPETGDLDDDDEHREEPRAAAGARGLDDHHEADVQRAARAPPPQQGGLIAYPDDDNYLKFDLEATSSTNLQFKTSLEDIAAEQPGGQQQSDPGQPDAQHDPDERRPAGEQHDLAAHERRRATPTRRSTRSTAHTWIPVWSTGATLSNVKVGPFAFNGAATTTSLHVAFDFFHLSGQ